MNKNIEILAPAGSKSALISAVAAGCNAVYLGYEKFSARSGAQNFNLDDLKWAVSYAHFHSVKTYLTINTLIKNSEIKNLLNLVLDCLKIGIDAFIVQDIGVLSLLKKSFPDISLHASTQMNVHSVYSSEFLKKLGLDRLILARELNLEEIKYIRDKVDIELESFVHGALCYSYSGQCLMSSSLGNRSGNRGSCAQPCRMAYTSNSNRQYIISLRDLSSINILPDIINSGVTSLKIEGRVKSDAYVYKVVSLYRKYLDMLINGNPQSISKSDLEEILQVYNRGEFSSGFYETHNAKKLIGRDSPKHSGIEIGKVTKIKGNTSFVRLKTPVKKGDYLSYNLSGKNSVITADKDYEETFVIHNTTKIGTGLRRLSSVDLTKTIEENNGIKNIKISICAEFKIGEKSKITVRTVNSKAKKEYEFFGSTVLEAKNMPLSFTQIYNKLNKSMDFPFDIQDIRINMDENIFLPISQINELRRKGLEGFFYENIDYKKEEKIIPIKAKNKKYRKYEIRASINSIKQYDTVNRYPLSHIYIDVLNASFDDINYIINKKGSKKIYAIAPKIIKDLLKDELKKLREKLLLFDGILVQSIDSYAFVKDLNKSISLDYSFNIFNNESIKFYKELGIENFMPSIELNYNELKDMDNADAEYLLYAHITTMTTASCIKKNTDFCHKKEGSFYYISDRKKEKIFYETKCTFCYNKLYNPYPLYLIDRLDKLRDIGFSKFRLDFNFEDNSRIQAILDEVFYQKKASLDKFTRGHFDKAIK